MTLQQMEYIVAVDKFRHFSKAAEYCKVTQPTLSAMIQRLEDELEVRIFDRTQQPVCPTAIGSTIISQATNILKQVDVIKETIAEEKGSISGEFHIGIIPTIAPYLLPRFFHQLEKKYPDLNFRIYEMKTAEIKEALLLNNIDAGIVATFSCMEGEFNIFHLYYEQFYAYISTENRLSQNNVIKTTDLTNEQLWMLDEGHCFRDQLVKFCQLKSAQTSQLTYNLRSLDTFMRMVENGNGITFIPELAITQLNDNQKMMVKPFAIPTPTRHISIITNKNFIRNKILNAIIEEIQTSIPVEMKSLKKTQAII